MADYISREAAEKILYDGCHTTDGEEMLDDVVEMWHMVQAIPVADVRPVVRGEWLSYSDPRFPDLTCYCSECSQTNERLSNFCPSCGADMRKAQDGN